MKRRVMHCRLAILMAEQLPPLTQKKIARETKLSPTTVNQLFNNSFKRVDASTVEALCNYFECDIGNLFTMREVSEDETT